MSKQLTLSATLSVFGMATLALLASFADLGAIGSAELAAHGPLLGTGLPR